MQQRNHPSFTGRRTLALLGAMAVLLGALVWAARATDILVHLDAALAGLLSGAWLAPLGAVSWETSALAGTDLILPLTGAAVAFLLAGRHWHGAVTLGVAVLATQGVVDLLKSAVARPRPLANEFVAEAAGHSFPSAHSATAVAFYATVALLIAHRRRGAARVVILVAAATVVLAIGLSRVKLGAHYPVDVLAGWLTGAVLVLASWTLVARIAPPRPAARPGV